MFDLGNERGANGDWSRLLVCLEKCSETVVLVLISEYDEEREEISCRWSNLNCANFIVF